MTLAETHMGIEVSLSHSPNSEPGGGGSGAAAGGGRNHHFVKRGGQGPPPAQAAGQQQQQQQQSAAAMAAAAAAHLPLPRLNPNNQAFSSSSSSVISFNDELVARQKVVRTQFNVTQWPILGPPPPTTTAGGHPMSRGQQQQQQHAQSSSSSHNHLMRPALTAPLLPSQDPQRGGPRHRVQFTQQQQPLVVAALLGGGGGGGGGVGTSSAAAASAEKQTSQLSFEDALFLLSNHEIVDEATCVQEELTRLNSEIDALKEDKNVLERRSLQIPASSSPTSMMTGGGGGGGVSNNSMNNNHGNVTADWEIHHLLLGNRLTAAQRSQLQEHRGLTLTAHLHNPKAAEALASRCGAKGSIVQQCIQVDSAAIIELSPETCRDGGAATTIQHVALMNKQEHGSETAFFVSRDNGKGYYWGLLPDRLFRRLRSNGMDPKRAALDLVYLATGPLDYYFAEFRSGETWWGSAVDDRAFHTICSEWDVYRVVFGTALTLEDAEGQRHATASWIILGRDGRAAWKNLPARLDLKLQTRMADEAAVAEVALGSGDSYFVRFLDGTVDYCLPSTMAYVCQQLEKQGSTITSVSIHPELSHDFIIRSSSIPPG
jgi:hypothetical protein